MIKAANASMNFVFNPFSFGDKQIESVKLRCKEIEFWTTHIHANVPQDSGAFYLHFNDRGFREFVYDLSMANTVPVPIYEWSVFRLDDEIELIVRYSGFIPRGYAPKNPFVVTLVLEGIRKV